MTRDKHSLPDPLTRHDPSAPYAGEAWPHAKPVRREFTAGATGTTAPNAIMTTGDSQRPDDRRILNECAALGLSLLQAVQLANANDPRDPQSLLRVLNLDFSTYAPMPHRSRKRWLRMAAQTSSVSYRGTLTEDALLEILTTGIVPADFEAHVGHLLDEAPIDFVVFSIAEAAQKSQTSIQLVWGNVAQLARRYSNHRQALWAMFACTDRPPADG
jgi:hypothetical protein